MKTTNKGIIQPINKDEMNELLKETEEKIATGFTKKTGSGTFGIVDLWRMQKKHKTLGSSTRW